jgi:hypothetical protein
MGLERDRTRARVIFITRFGIARNIIITRLAAAESFLALRVAWTVVSLKMVLFRCISSSPVWLVYWHARPLECFLQRSLGATYGHVSGVVINDRETHPALWRLPTPVSALTGSGRNSGRAKPGLFSVIHLGTPSVVVSSCSFSGGAN